MLGGWCGRVARLFECDGLRGSDYCSARRVERVGSHVLSAVCSGSSTHHDLPSDVSVVADSVVPGLLLQADAVSKTEAGPDRFGTAGASADDTGPLQTTAPALCTSCNV